MAEEKDSIQIQVVYAQRDRQELVALRMPAGTTVQQALDASGLQQKHPEIDFSLNKVGLFGKLAKLDAVLRSGDRVEIYRPLIADPKEVRRKRAEEGLAMKKGGGTLDA